MSKDDITFVIAIIGCVTGVVGLLINIIKFYRENKKIKIALLQFQFVKSVKKGTLSLNVRIEIDNLSSSQLTIQSVMIQLPLAHREYEDDIIPYLYDNKKRKRPFVSLPACEYTEISGDKLSFPYQISGGDGLVLNISARVNTDIYTLPKQRKMLAGVIVCDTPYRTVKYKVDYKNIDYDIIDIDYRKLIEKREERDFVLCSICEEKSKESHD